MTIYGITINLQIKLGNDTKIKATKYD